MTREDEQILYYAKAQKRDGITPYKEIFKLKKMLEEAHISFEWDDSHMDGYQIRIPKLDFDAIENYGSYGARQDLLEIMGLLTNKEHKQDSVKGYLTAKNVFNRIVKALNK